MTEEIKITTKPSIIDQEYPFNLLDAIVQYTKIEAPISMTPDRIRGLQYAMSTLEPREYEVLMYR